MRILLISKNLPYASKGAISSHVWKLSDHLTRRGHHVSMLTAGSFGNRLREGKVDGRHVIELPLIASKHIPTVSTSALDWAFNQNAVQWVLTNQQRFDIIHLQGRSGAAILSQKKNIHVPIVSTLHGFISDEYSFDSEIYEHKKDAKLYRRLACDLENLSLEKSDRIIAVSRYLQNGAIQRASHLAQRSSVVPNGIEVSQRPKEPLFNENRLLFVGRVERIKGVFQLLDALKLTKRQMGLTIVGNGRERMAMESHICSLGLDERVRTVGNLEENEVEELIDESYALIAPAYLESQGDILMEANMRCKPVLASNIPGINEVVSHGRNGLLFPAGDTQAMAKNIDYLFSDRVLAQNLGAEGRLRMETEFSWGTIAAQTEDVYHNIMKKNQFFFKKPNTPRFY